LFGVELTPDGGIRFEDLEFIANHFDNLSPSPKEDDSSTIVGGMARSGSPSLHAILEESPSDDEVLPSAKLCLVVLGVLVEDDAGPCDQ
jgi:hypothetical protein